MVTSCPARSQLLVLDAPTLKDLEVFASTQEGMSLFELCNRTRTDGGEKVLRRRMGEPWSSAERIRDTQAALGFIIEQRPLFDALPSAYVARRVEQYARGVMPIVAHTNSVEFAIGAGAMWAGNHRFFINIVRGAQFCHRLVQALRRLVRNVRALAPMGELAPLVDEMHALLARPVLAAIPDGDDGLGAWATLRLDQVFRLQERAAVEKLLALAYEVDALVSLADVTREQGFLLPEVEDGALHVHAEGLVHPLVDDAVGNPVELNQTRRLLFLTGPNMAGKTTYLRAFATALYLAHLGMGVPAQRFRFAPAERLFSALSLSDDLHGGVSYFRAEALRVKAVAAAVADGYRVVAIMDEPFKGTNVKDALDASLAILERLSIRDDCLFMVSSHLIELGDRLGEMGQIDCRYFEAQELPEDEGRLRFDYRLRAGISNQRLGMRVLREEGVFGLLDGT